LLLYFRKVNEKTVPDRYPKPIISMILGNLGKILHDTRSEVGLSTNHARWTRPWEDIVLSERREVWVPKTSIRL